MDKEKHDSRDVTETGKAQKSQESCRNIGDIGEIAGPGDKREVYLCNEWALQV